MIMSAGSLFSSWLTKWLSYGALSEMVTLLTLKIRFRLAAYAARK